LAELESSYQLLTSYCWLSYQFEETFQQRDLAKKLQLKCSQVIERILKSGLTKESKTNKKKTSKKEKRMRYQESIDIELGKLGF
jgi:hypothetical protein